MSSLVDDFEDRRRQVRHYLAIVLGSERAAGGSSATITQERRLLTLRAGTFLIFYNLIEASTRAAIEAIHDRIITDQEPFERLIPCLRREAVKRFKKHAKPDVHHTMNSFPAAFVAVALASSTEISGNVDARVIRELGAIYGFSCETTKEITWNGSDLLTIKTTRNDLGHGRKSFEEVGRDYPAVALLAMSRRALPFMRTILLNVTEYLDEKRYLET